MKSSRGSQRSLAVGRMLVRVCGGFSIAMGLTVIAGWYLHIRLLIQLQPNFAPMQYNTALNFLLLGTGLLFIASRRFVPANVLSALGGLAGLLVISEYMTGIDLRVDTLFFKPYISTKVLPGRMSLGAAVCFTLLALAFFCAFPARNRKWGAFLMALLTSCVNAICLLAVVGYSLDLTAAYEWLPLSAMALHTAIGLVVLSLGTFTHACMTDYARQGSAPRWLPVPLGLGVLVAAVILSQAVHEKQLGQLQRTVHAKADDAANQIRTQIDTRLLALDRMAERRGFKDQEEEVWRNDAKNYIEDFAGFKAIEWVDPSFVIRWVEPLAGNEAALNLNLTKESRRHEAVKRARDSGAPMLTRPVTLVQGGKGLLCYVPIKSNEKFAGLIVGVFQTKELFDSVLPPTLAKGMGISIFDGSEKVYIRAGEMPENLQTWQVENRIDFHGVSWLVRAWPTPQMLAEQHSPLPMVIIAAGICAAVLFAMTLFLAQQALYQTRVVKSTNENLQREITERKRKEAELSESEERFRLMVDGVTDYAILMLDPDGRVATWNAGAQRLKGYEAREIIGQHFSHFYPPEQRKTGEPQEELEIAKREGRFEEEGWRVRKDGSRFWASVILAPVHDEKGILRGFSKVTRDLTERRKAAQALNETVTLQRAILDNAAYSIIAGTPEGIITVFNRTAEKMLGYTAEEMVGKQTPAVIHLESEVVARAEELSKELGQRVEPGFDTFVIKSRLGLPNESEWTYVRKDRSTFPVLLGITALRDNDGNITGYLGIANDITQRRQAEEEKRRMQLELEESNRDLVEKNREIQNFYHTLSHELKTPLTSIREFVAIVLDGLAGEVNAEQREYLTIARESCKQMQLCINDLLDVTRIETGKLSVTLEPARLDELLQRLVVSLVPIAQEKDLQLELQCEPDLPLIELDEARISQVIMNLVGNSFKFTPAGGRVTVRAFTPEHRRDFVAVAVQDTGRGIPPEKLDRIFERLYQVKESDASTEQGTGLGLYICRELVHLHGGDFEVNSVPNEGSSFTFCLPKKHHDESEMIRYTIEPSRRTAPVMQTAS